MHRLPNFTRRSASIPRRLLREGKPHLLPVYGAMLLSDLAREGIEHSGSYRFADHVYRNEPSGRYGLGYLLDAMLLRFPAARSMRNRYLHSRDRIVAEALRLATSRADAINVVSVPCGIARELVEAAQILDARVPAASAGVRFHGIDLDPQPLEQSRILAGPRDDFSFVQGDAFDPAVYPARPDVIVSTGFLDFLDDADAARFCAVCHSVLRPGGLFVTSAQQPQRLADYLMREIAELRPHYRDGIQLERVLRLAGFADVAWQRDTVGLQALATARKGGTQ